MRHTRDVPASDAPSIPDTYANWRDTAQDLHQRLTAMQPILRRLADSTHSSRRIREFSQAMTSIQTNFARHLDSVLRNPPRLTRLSEVNLSAPTVATTTASRTATAAAAAPGPNSVRTSSHSRFDYSERASMLERLHEEIGESQRCGLVDFTNYGGSYCRVSTRCYSPHSREWWS